jgi:hypothetical protein
MFEIELTGIEPGSVLAMSECERLFGYTRETNPVKYQFDLMRLADYVGKELAKIGLVYTVVCDGSDVRVLTHEQASDYNQQHFSNAIKKMRKCHKRLMAVDTRELEAERIKMHDKSIVRQSRILQTIKSISRGSEVEVTSRKLDRPALFKKEQ